jgi:hypothetical protein
MFKNLSFFYLLFRVRNEARKRMKKSGVMAIIFGLLSAAGMGIIQEAEKAYPGIQSNVTKVVYAGVAGALLKWLKSGRTEEEQAKLFEDNETDKLV